MKLFDGTNKYAYQTLFGIVNIEPYEENENHYYVLKMITDTTIKLPVKITPNAIIDYRKFDTRYKALKFLKKLENQSLEEIQDLLKLVI